MVVQKCKKFTGKVHYQRNHEPDHGKHLLLWAKKLGHGFIAVENRAIKAV